MCRTWPTVRFGLTSAACWMLLLTADARAQQATVGDEQGDAIQVSSAAAIVNTTAGRGRLNVNVAEWLTSALATSAQQQASAPSRRDSPLNGLLIGAGVGALVGLIPDHYDDCAECHDSLYASIGVGAGVGLLVDLLRAKSTATSSSGTQASLLLGVGPPSTRVRVGGVVRWR